ncbi:hypothetical protein KIW84_058319 [Lathyrus oleraceus]|uniref:Arabidopsis retrotransposon Orf1 C-terminal domain-containing protein n=1 Tax=Pisum sativum TaxID=3888 RepID=A0A9D5ANW4_PEA|nr:hypothetical protein KIW84_058319 [Pisum sativum]
MRIIFKNDIQRSRYEELAERIISSTKYTDFPSLIALGLRDGVHYMLNHMSWDHFFVVKHPTYKNLNLEFLRCRRLKICCCELVCCLAPFWMPFGAVYYADNGATVCLLNFDMAWLGVVRKSSWNCLEHHGYGMEIEL